MQITACRQNISGSLAVWHQVARRVSMRQRHEVQSGHRVHCCSVAGPMVACTSPCRAETVLVLLLDYGCEQWRPLPCGATWVCRKCVHEPNGQSVRAASIRPTLQLGCAFLGAASCQAVSHWQRCSSSGLGLCTPTTRGVLPGALRGGLATPLAGSGRPFALLPAHGRPLQLRRAATTAALGAAWGFGGRTGPASTGWGSSSLCRGSCSRGSVCGQGPPRVSSPPVPRRPRPCLMLLKCIPALQPPKQPRRPRHPSQLPLGCPETGSMCSATWAAGCSGLRTSALKAQGQALPADCPDMFTTGAV